MDVVGARPPLGPPDLRGAWAARGAVDRALLDFVRARDRGLIRPAAGVDPARLVAQLALAYPALSLVALVPREANARRLARAQRRDLPVTVWATLAFAGIRGARP